MQSVLFTYSRIVVVLCTHDKSIARWMTKIYGAVLLFSFAKLKWQALDPKEARISQDNSGLKRWKVVEEVMSPEAAFLDRHTCLRQGYPYEFGSLCRKVWSCDIPTSIRSSSHHWTLSYLSRSSLPPIRRFRLWLRSRIYQRYEVVSVRMHVIIDGIERRVVFYWYWPRGIGTSDDSFF